ncbi:uncharacterized protein LOC130805222 isoform X2 [Amaranthus tricolor]|uniref:uncharacterized protein LOC130805222 isoform X2 n=1 Tax=Amaranthus tricolor TaxID=29722 RepID=UPI002586BDD7|nr:uncharacterized protein LOC130805222 isoform X2 [Amaranthus tricolor]
MGETSLKHILTRSIKLADQITKASNEVIHFKSECLELQTKTIKLGELIRQAARASNNLYEKPTRRIINDTQQVLEKALILINKCKTRSLFKRIFTLVPNSAFRKIITQLDNSLGNVTWILRATITRNDDIEDSKISYLGLPPIAANEPILCLIWEQVANLSSEERTDAASSLVSLANDNQRYRKMIVEEGGVGPLLKLAKEAGNPKGQENAIRCIGVLGCDEESVETIIDSGVCSIFCKLLKDDGVIMKVKAMVAWAISELVYNYPQCKDDFMQFNVIRVLVNHLAFETIEEHNKYAIVERNKMQAINQIQQNMHMTNLISDNMRLIINENNYIQNHQDQEVKVEMKAMAARALWYLAKGNTSICSSITESRALLCFATLLQNGQDDVKYNSAMAILEITNVAEKNTDLRQIAFKPTSPATKAVKEQLLNVVTNSNNAKILLPCIKSLGNLARIFRAKDTTRIIESLVRLIVDENEIEVTFEMLRIPALKLLCYLGQNAPDSEAFTQEDVLTPLEWAKEQDYFMQHPQIGDLLFKATSILELYQLRVPRL